ncbi:MAG TPA: type II secretion system protein [bacterium]|jgi:prepilin-type N-terminal cleavage/methylation domain-containing protein|nr:type II secretion system protein [bacterium]
MNISIKNQKGFTFVELMVVVALLLIVTTLVTVLVHPLDQLKKGRDNQRLSDINLLDRAINEYLLDNSRYPDQINVLRSSNALPSGSSDLSNSNPGWIYENLSSYTERLPIDPTNDSEFFYSYIHNETSYEINAKLEYFTEMMVDDGGNSDEFYEVGNNLNLITH